MSLGPHDSSSAETAENRLPADTGLFDFRSVANFPRDYLATYCRSPRSFRKFTWLTTCPGTSGR
jgi:hypothetical protein